MEADSNTSLYSLRVFTPILLRLFFWLFLTSPSLVSLSFPPVFLQSSMSSYLAILRCYVVIMNHPYDKKSDRSQWVENEWVNEWNDWGKQFDFDWKEGFIHTQWASIDRSSELFFPLLSINNLPLYSKRQFYSALSTTVTIGVVRWEILYHPSSSTSSSSQCWSLHVSCPWNIRYSIGWSIRRMVKNEWRRSQSTTN